MFQSKSHAAMVFTAERFAEWAGTMFFWTLTFKEVYPDWRYGPKWSALRYALCGNTNQKKYKGVYPGLAGIRVIEVHPGGHGLHFHVLVNKYLDIKVLQAIGEQWGFGHMWVERVKNPRAAIYYLAKYLSKNELPLYKGMHRWDTFGSFPKTHVRDMEIDSAFARTFKEIAGGRQVRYDVYCMIRKFCILYGDYDAWPDMAKEIIPAGSIWIGRRVKSNMDRHFAYCIHARMDEGYTGHCFWSANDASMYARLSNLDFGKTYMCGKCGSVHAQMAQRPVLPRVMRIGRKMEMERIVGPLPGTPKVTPCNNEGENERTK